MIAESGQGDEMASAALVVAAILPLVNQARMRHHVLPLRVEPKLQRAADHCPDNDRILICVRRYIRTRLAGENTAWGQVSLHATFLAWMHSPGHRANILNPGYTVTALAIRKEVVVQVFARTKEA